MTKAIITVEQIEARCHELGINLNDLCYEAKVNRSILVRWKKELPKTFQILTRINQVLEKHATVGAPAENPDGLFNKVVTTGLPFGDDLLGTTKAKVTVAGATVGTAESLALEEKKERKARRPRIAPGTPSENTRS